MCSIRLPAHALTRTSANGTRKLIIFIPHTADTLQHTQAPNRATSDGSYYHRTDWRFPWCEQRRPAFGCEAFCGVFMMSFELVNLALDELYCQGCKKYGECLDKVILKQIKYLSTRYASLHHETRNPVDYKDPATRFAYVYKYVTAHSDYLIQVMQLLRSKLGGNIFTNKTARITCVGGGPGTDIIAILKYLTEHQKKESVERVTCHLLDREQAWADTWTELSEHLDLALQLTANFQPLDVIEPASWEFQQKFLRADLFTMSYFVSEVHRLDKNGEVSQFWSALFQGAKPGALFAYVDNGHMDLNGYFDAQWKAAGLTCLISGNNIRRTPRPSEQASALGIYRQKFGHDPKLQGFLSYRVVRKA